MLVPGGTGRDVVAEASGTELGQRSIHTAQYDREPAGQSQLGGGVGAERGAGGRGPDLRQLAGADPAPGQQFGVPAPAFAVEHPGRRRGHRVGPPLARDQLEEVVLGPGEAGRHQRPGMVTLQPAQLGRPVADVGRAERALVRAAQRAKGTAGRRRDRVDLGLFRRRPGVRPQDDLVDTALASAGGPGRGQAAGRARQDEGGHRGGRVSGHLADAGRGGRAHLIPGLRRAASRPGDRSDRRSGRRLDRVPLVVGEGPGTAGADVHRQYDLGRGSGPGCVHGWGSVLRLSAGTPGWGPGPRTPGGARARLR